MAQQADRLETPIDAQEVPMYQNLWRMWGWHAASHQECMDRVTEYVGLLKFKRYFTEGYMFNRSMGDQLFLICAVSTGESTRLMKENVEALRAGLTVSECYWCRFQVYTVHGVILGNIAGMTDYLHHGQLQEYDLGRLILQMADMQGMNASQARGLLGMSSKQGTLVSVLGQALTAIRVPTWWAVNTGLCMNEYAGLDVYVKYLSPAMLDHTGSVSHWVLNASRPWYERRVVSAEEWWRCPDWLSYGQRDPGLGIDAEFERLKARILVEGPAGLAVAHQQYQGNPTTMYALLHEVFMESPLMFRIPLVRQHWLALSCMEMQMRSHREEQKRRGMDPQQVQRALPSPQVLPDLNHPLRPRI